VFVPAHFLNQAMAIEKEPGVEYFQPKENYNWLTGYPNETLRFWEYAEATRRRRKLRNNEIRDSSKP